MDNLIVGSVYYVPSKHRLVQVRNVQMDAGVVEAGGFCNFFGDTKTTISQGFLPLSETTTWELVTDPSTYPHLEHHPVTGAWCVIEDHLCKEEVTARLQKIATVLKEASCIQNVYVFGSVARDGVGNDFDIIATVPTEVWEHWQRKINGFFWRMSALKRSRGIGLYFNARLRLEVAKELLEDASLLDYLESSVCPISGVKGTRGYPIDMAWMGLDLFLFPVDWQDRLPELQDALPHDDPHFMENIARDARLIEST